MSNTVEHFWQMVLQENVKLIVGVCKLRENGQSKCHKYWPEGDSREDVAFKGLIKSDIVI